MRPSLIALLSLAILVATLPALSAGQASNNAQTSLVGFSLTVTPDTLSIQNGNSVNAAEPSKAAINNEYHPNAASSLPLREVRLL